MARHGTEADLRGKVVVVTGAGQGIGASLARQLSARGARLALLDLRAEQLEQVAAEVGDARWWVADVTDREALARVRDEVLAHFGRVDVVVANAGLGWGGPLLVQDPQAYEAVIEVNLLGSVRTVREFLPALVNSRGYVLQVASLAALVPAPMMSAYCASKSGVEAFAHCLRGEVLHHGVDVGVAYLTWTDTDMVRGADKIESMRAMRTGMPGIFSRTYPLEPAVARLVDGIAARKAHVYAQPWVAAVPWVRGLLPSLVARARTRQIAETEAALRAAAAAGDAAVLRGSGADVALPGRRPA